MEPKKILEKKKLPIWVTRWALTQGIKTVDAEISQNGTFASYKVDGYSVHVHGKDFHLTHEAAVANANERVVKKIASVEKQLDKLRKLSFY